MARLDDSPGSVLEQLRLPSELFDRQAAFYAGYAETLEGLRAAADDDLPFGTVWDRLANPRQDWEGFAAIASTYRLAAECAALVDTIWSMELAIRSARAFLDAGSAFGLFLAASILDDEALLQERSTLFSLIRPLTAETAAAPVPDPVQRSYLALTFNSRPLIREMIGNSGNAATNLSNLAEGLGPYALQPVGPQSIPMADYLEFADAVRDIEWPAREERYPGRYEPLSDSGRRGLADLGASFAGLCRRQADDLRAAMRNRYLWENGASPVNVVDLEYVAVCGNAMRRFPDQSWSIAFRESVTEHLEDDPLAQLPVWLAGRMERLIPEIRDRIPALLRGDEPPTMGQA